MATLSAVIIVKNEAPRIEACLQSLHWADEIIIVDAGSDDETLDIARQFTDKIYQNTDWQGFGKQRQLAQRYASSHWILAIDADERVTPPLQESIQAAINSYLSDTVYQINRKNWAFGKFILHGGWSPDWVVRLYPNCKTTYSDDLVHEQVLVPAGMQTKKLGGRLLHFTYDNLFDYSAKVNHYTRSWADQKHLEGKRCTPYSGISHGFAAFVRMFILKKGFLDGGHGLILATLTAYTTMTKYFDLWLRNQENRDEA